MIGGLLTFLIGVVVILIVLAVVHVVLRRIPLDADVLRIVWMIVGLIMLVALIFLLINAFGLAGPRWPAW